MPTLTIHGIEDAFLTIDGVRVAPLPYDRTIPSVAPVPYQYVVSEGWHALRYDLAAHAAARGIASPTFTANGVTTTVDPLPITVRVYVPEHGLELRRFDHALVDVRGIQTPTGYTGSLALCEPQRHTLTPIQRGVMVVGTASFAVLLWRWLTDEE